MTYRFIGTEAEVAGSALKRFGQTITFPDAEHAKDAVVGAGREQGYAGAIAAIPDEEFVQIGFTDAELRKYMYPAHRVNVPAEFGAKVQSAFAALDAHRQELESDGGEV